MQLQFFYIEDLCQFMDILLEQKPKRHIFNVGNRKTISIRDWISLCYGIAGKDAEFINVNGSIEQRNYFSFYNYEYCLNVKAQEDLMPETTLLEDGLEESFKWYLGHSDAVNSKPFIQYIDTHLN